MARARCRCSRTCRAPRCSSLASSRNVSAIHFARSGSPGIRTSGAISPGWAPMWVLTTGLATAPGASPRGRDASRTSDLVSATRTTGRGCGAPTRPGSTSAGRTPRPGCWWSPARGSARSTAGAVGRARRDAPDGPRVLLGERRRGDLVRADRRPRGGTGGARGWARAARSCRRRRAPTDAEAPLVFHAIGLAEWHFATRFCPRCGGRAGVAAGRPRAGLHGLRPAQFPRTDPAVIMAITHGEPGADDELPARPAASWPEGRYSTLAGFREPGETLEDAVRREVQEEVGVRVGEVTYFGNQPWPLPASLMLGFVGRARDHARSTSTARRSRTPAGSPASRCGRRPRPGRCAARRRLDLPVLVEHWYGGPLEPVPAGGGGRGGGDGLRPMSSAADTQRSGRRNGTGQPQASEASFCLDLGHRGVRLGGAVGVDEGRHRLVAAVGLLHDRARRRGAARCRRSRTRCPRGRAGSSAGGSSRTRGWCTS